jgi:HD superfamily phosphohydrolase
MAINRKLVCYASLVVSIVAILFFLIYENQNKKKITTCWGEEFTIPESIDQVMQSKVVQRLKGVDQSGPPRFFGQTLPKFSRYEHSVEVWALLAKFGASTKEQVAGLLHDVSHTVFSHVSDYVFSKDSFSEFTDRGYQDSIHKKFLKTSGIDKVVRQIGLNNGDLNPESGEFTLLEQPLPDMCADRIQYNVKTGLIMGIISKDTAKEIINNLSFKKGKWFFSDKKVARKFAELSLYFTQTFWGAKWNVMLNIYFARAIKRALEIKLIRNEDLFSTDEFVLEKLKKSDDNKIQNYLQQCETQPEKIEGVSYSKKEVFRPKFRGIDPLVLENGEMRRLTEVDIMFRCYYEAVKEWCQKGFEIEVPGKA